MQEGGKDKSHRRRLVINAIKLLIAGGIFWGLVRYGHLDLSKLSRIHHWDWAALAGAVMLMLAAMTLPVWRWRMLTRVQGLEMSFWLAMRVCWLGYYASLILPGGTGGDLAKGYIIMPRTGGGRTRALSTVLVDRVMGLYSLLLLGTIGSIWLLASEAPWKVKGSAWVAVGLFAAMNLGAAAAASRRTSGLIIRFLPSTLASSLRDSLDRYRACPAHMLRILFISAVSSACLITAYALTAQAMGQGVGAQKAALVFPLVVVANALPLTPGGLGVGETVGSQLFKWIGLADGALVVLVVRFISVALSLPGVAAMFGVKERGLQNAPAGGGNGD